LAVGNHANADNFRLALAPHARQADPNHMRPAPKKQAGLAAACKGFKKLTRSEKRAYSYLPVFASFFVERVLRGG
jgi:hypothetical protein